MIRYLLLSAYIVTASLCYWAFPSNPAYALFVLPMMILGGIVGAIVCGSLLVMGSGRR